MVNMKKCLILVSLGLLLPVLSANAVKLTVKNSQIIDIGEAYHPLLSDNGEKLLYTSDNYRGLHVLDMGSMNSNEISSSEGAGYSPVINFDGSKVYYRNMQLDGRLRKKNVMMYDCIKGGSVEVLPMGRSDVKLMQTAGEIAVLNDDKIMGDDESGSKTSVYAYSMHDRIVVQTGNVLKELNPLPSGSRYLWVKLSPDHKKILFVEPFEGVFVCDIDGTNAKRIAEDGSSPSWYGNNVVLFTRSQDDGYHVTASQIMAVDVNTGEESQLTTPESMAEDASGSITSGKIVYSNANGTLRLLEINVVE